MKRVSSEEKPCSLLVSSATSPWRSPTTNVLLSRTLMLRSRTRNTGGSWDERGPGHRTVGLLIGRGDHIDITVRGHPSATLSGRDARQATDRGGHGRLVIDQEPGMAVHDELARRAL